MNSIQVFIYKPKYVHTVILGCEPWLVAKGLDFCDILELRDVSMSVRSLDEDEKGTSSIYTPGRMQYMTIISEPGFYVLIFRSNNLEAKQFSRLARHEALPAIYHTGSYTSKMQDNGNMFSLQGAKFILEMKGINGNQLTLALYKIYTHCTGFSSLEAAGIELISPTKTNFLTLVAA